MAVSAVTKNSENIKQTISHELPNGCCQNMCYSEAFIEFLSRCDIAFRGILVTVEKSFLKELSSIEKEGKERISYFHGKPGCLEQSIGHLTQERDVPGSIPVLSTFFRFYR